MGNSSVRDDDRLMSLVESAMALPTHLRDDYLNSACDTLELREAVADYVQREERLQGFLQAPLFPRGRGDERPFEPEQLIEARFRIVREIARGGMGIVYEAFDEKLDRRIAIKCAKSAFRKRLPPEVRNASEISHPNVCKIFEIHTARLPQGELDFLTMEYLEGETLAERLRRGKLPEDEARSIARQLCTGLAEAHRNRLVHGDLKTNNVILTKDRHGHTRAVITDFGLARRPDASPNVSNLPSGLMAGAPDYMAPELWKGGKPTLQTDIYAMGAMLYEMIGGRRLFTEEDTFEQRLKRRPQPVHVKWDGVLRRCLSLRPEDRFADAAELARAIDPPRKTGWWLAAAAAVVLAVVTGWITYQQTKPTGTILQLAILPFGSDASTTGLANAMLQDTSDRLMRAKPGRTKFTFIPFNDVIADKRRRPTSAEAKAMFGATHVLWGSLREENGRILLEARLSDTRTGYQLAAWPGTYDKNEMARVPDFLVGKVAQELGLPAVTSATTVSPAAYPAWSEGVALTRGDPNDIDRALGLLEKAMALNPTSPLTHARLAEAQLRKYELTGDEKWKELAAQSIQKAESLNSDAVEVHYASGRMNTILGRYEQAEMDFERALDAEPMNGDLWREQGIALRRRGRFNDAMVKFQKALDLQPSYYRNYQSIGAMYYAQGNFDEAANQYKKMVDLVPSLPDAHFELSRPYLTAGRYADADRELRIALQLRETSNAFLNLGVSLMFQDKDREAIPNYLRALELGPPPNNKYLLYINMGTAYRRAGQIAEARASYAQAREFAYGQLKNKPNDGTIRAGLAYVQARLGDREEAIHSVEQAIASAPQSEPDVLWMAIQTYEAVGDREASWALVKEAPSALLKRITQFSDLQSLQKDPRFISKWATVATP